MNAIEKVLARYPKASPCHNGGMVVIGETVWKKVWVRRGFSKRMAAHHPITRRMLKHIQTIPYSSAFDFNKLGPAGGLSAGL